MSAELRLASSAEADLAAAFDWYERRGPGLGGDFVRCVDATIALLHRSPQLFRLRHGEYRLATVPRFPYGVYFIWDQPANRISVRRVLHFAQNAPALL